MTEWYPRFDVGETAKRLRGSLETVEWALSMVPVKYTHSLPDFYPPEDWTVAMNVAHLTIYDERIAIPLLKSLAAGGDGVGVVKSLGESWFYDDAKALSVEPLSVLGPRLRSARGDQAAVVESFSDDSFNARVTPLWATGRHGNPPHSPGWIATKSFQHTWEHGNAVLRMALFAPRE